MFSKDYWNQRAKQFGHTGHSEPFYYCFDQQARLFAIEQVLMQLYGIKSNAFDFGCGSGDFLTLLNDHYQHVTGYDISELMVERVNRLFVESSSILATNDFGSISSNAYDLILSVTVLQTFSKQQLNDSLHQLSSMLSPNGHLVAMDFFSSASRNSQYNENKATEDDWLEALCHCKLRIHSTFNFYNPVTHPSTSWKKYNSSILLRILRLAKSATLVQEFFSARARKLIHKYKDVMVQENSGCKIYLIKRD